MPVSATVPPAGCKFCHFIMEKSFWRKVAGAKMLMWEPCLCTGLACDWPRWEERQLRLAPLGKGHTVASGTVGTGVG